MPNNAMIRYTHLITYRYTCATEIALGCHGLETPVFQLAAEAYVLKLLAFSKELIDSFHHVIAFDPGNLQ